MKLAKTLAPSENHATGLSITDGPWTLATDLSVRVDESISKLPTNPHVFKFYTFLLEGHQINWTTPDTIIDTSGGRYFRSLIEYQTRSGLIEAKDASRHKFEKLIKKMKDEIIEYNALTIRQQFLFRYILDKLSKNINISIHNLSIRVSAENELAVYKTSESGTSLIVVGETSSDVSFIYISNEAGKYNTVSLSNEIKVDNIIDLFISA